MTRARDLIPPLVAVTTLSPALAAGAVRPAGWARGHPVIEAARRKAGGGCGDGVPVFGGLVSDACSVGSAIAHLPGEIVGLGGQVAGFIASSVFDQATQWVASGAAHITALVLQAMQATTTPELQSSWYQAQFAGMAMLGGGLALLVAMLALSSAALRRDPDALAATLAGLWRAGVGTALVVGVTVIALSVCDQITASITASAVGHEAQRFWTAVQGAWGHGLFAALGSSVIAFFFALFELFAACAVWIEMFFRGAAIYVAVLFMPLTLAASVWPTSSGWTRRLSHVLVVFVVLKPVTVIVLSLAGAAAQASLVGRTQGPVGVLLSAMVIYALAALSPWALMALIGAEAEAAISGKLARDSAAQRTGQLASSAGGLGGRLAGALAPRGVKPGQDPLGPAGGGRGGSPRPRGGPGRGGGGGRPGPAAGSPSGHRSARGARQTARPLGAVALASGAGAARNAAAAAPCASGGVRGTGERGQAGASARRGQTGQRTERSSAAQPAVASTGERAENGRPDGEGARGDAVPLALNGKRARRGNATSGTGAVERPSV
jgi:hypothetical protein